VSPGAECVPIRGIGWVAWLSTDHWLFATSCTSYTPSSIARVLLAAVLHVAEGLADSFKLGLGLGVVG
jgi:hypothetical protein